MHKIIKSKLLLLIIIISIGVFLRFFKLADYPVHLSHDEISQLYDAISIAQTGKDVYGNFLPFVFPSTNDFKPPFYIYITTIFYFLFGMREEVIRLPAAFFGSLIILAAFLFVNKLLKSTKVALIAAFLTAIAPFEIFFSRKSFENGAGILLVLIGFWLFLKHLDDKKMLWIYLATSAFALGMYTYFSHAIIIPMLLLSFLIIFRDNFWTKISKYKLAILLLIFLILPLVIVLLSNPSLRYRSQTVFIIQDPNLGRQLSYIPTGGLQSLLNVERIISYSFNRYLKQFDLKYLFGNGLELTKQNQVDIGPLFAFQLPFLILGIFYLLKLNFSKERKFIFAWIILGMIPSGLTFEEFSPHRVVIVFTMLNIISALGISESIKLVLRLKKKLAKLVLLAVLIVVLTINFIYFCHLYFINYPFEKSHTLQYPFKTVAQYIWSEYANYNSIVFDPQFGKESPIIGVGAHYYLAFYGNYPANKFQKEYHLGNKNREAIFDKFSIRQVYYPKDKDLTNALLIVSPWSVPEKDVDTSKIVKRFYFYDGTLAFYAIKQ